MNHTPAAFQNGDASRPNTFEFDFTRALGTARLDGDEFCCGRCNHQPLTVCSCGTCVNRRNAFGALLRAVAPDALRSIVRKTYRRWFSLEDGAPPSNLTLERAWLLNASQLSTSVQAFLQLAPQTNDIDFCIRAVAERQLHPKVRADERTVGFAISKRTGQLSSLVELQKGPHHNTDEWRRKDALKRKAASRTGVVLQEFFL